MTGSAGAESEARGGYEEAFGSQVEPEAVIEEAESGEIQTGEKQEPEAQPEARDQTPSQAPPAGETKPPIPHDAFIAQRVDFQLKLRERDAEIARLRREREEHERRQQEAAAEAPDVLLDPQKHTAWIMQQAEAKAEAKINRYVEPLQRTIAEQRLALSGLSTQNRIGAEKWAQLNDWIKQQPPEWHDDVRRCADPYGEAYQEFITTTTFTRLGPKTLDEFLEEQKANWLAEQQAQAAAQAPERPAPQAQQPRASNGQFAPQSSQPAPRRPAPSLASVEGSAPSAASPSGYDALFKK